jgi:hypothetical protein
MTVYDECSSADIGLRDTCGSYIFGMLDGLGFAAEGGFRPPICPTVTAISRKQLAMIYVQWARTHPQFLGKPRADAVFMALVDAFPCGK